MTRAQGALALSDHVYFFPLIVDVGYRVVSIDDFDNISWLRSRKKVESLIERVVDGHSCKSLLGAIFTIKAGQLRQQLEQLLEVPHEHVWVAYLVAEATQPFLGLDYAFVSFRFQHFFDDFL